MMVKCIVRVRVSNQLALRVRRAATKFATRRHLVSNPAAPLPPCSRVNLNMDGTWQLGRSVSM